MKTFNLYSAQTGDSFGNVKATSESDAVDRFAQRLGYANRQAMWDDGTFHYISAYAA